MQKNSAKFLTVLGTEHLIFNEEAAEGYMIKLGNSMKRNSIYSLRAAIYQIGDDSKEKRELKQVMIDELERAENSLLVSYLRSTFGLTEVK